MKKIILMAFFSITLIYPIMGQSTDFNFIALSDIHFDPFQGCHFKKTCKNVSLLAKAPLTEWQALLSTNYQQRNAHLLLGMDSNQYLLDKLLTQLNKTIKEKKPQFIIITGDFIAHGIEKNYHEYFHTAKGYKNFIRKLFQYLQYQLRSASNQTPLYFVMGNNDGYLGDYASNAGGQFFKDIQQDWPELTKSKGENSRLLSKSGNYAITSFPHWRLIVLNSNLFYKKTRGKLKAAYAKASLTWLSRQLSQAKTQKQKVLLFYHIPYGIQPSKRFLAPEVAALWMPDSNQTFFTLATQYKEIIKGIFHGHVHRKAFMVLHTNRAQPLSQTLISSISPIFGNQPMFNFVTVEKDKVLAQDIYL